MKLTMRKAVELLFAFRDVDAEDHTSTIGRHPAEYMLFAAGFELGYNSGRPAAAADHPARGPFALAERFGIQRTPKNAAERAFVEQMRAHGWEVCKRGWPDFFCVREHDGRVYLVEVKPYPTRKLKREQAIVLKALAAYGIPVARWSPEGGFVKIE